MASDYKAKQKERLMATFYDVSKAPAGKPFRFKGRPGRQMVKDPETGAVMSLQKFNGRQARRARRPA